MKIAWSDFFEDRVLTLAAALSFYTSLSLAPLVIFLLYVFRWMGPRGEEQLVAQVDAVVGNGAADLVRAIVEGSERQLGFSSLAGIIGIVTLVVSASGVFGQLQSALNRIWEVEARPGLGLKRWLRKRLLSAGMLGVAAFFLLVSLGASTLVGLLADRSGEGFAWRALSMTVSFAVFVLLFAAVFKFLPDVKLAWRDVWVAAVVTAGLFVVGKLVIGLYLAHKGLGSAYGAAGSLVVFLTWVYFTSALVFAGAELTQAWVRAGGRRLIPNRFAARVDEPAGIAAP